MRNSTQLKSDVYMQRYTPNEIKIGNNVKVNDDNDTTKDHFWAWASSDGKGKFVICWSDDRFSGQAKTMYQLYDSSGIPLGNNRIANTSVGYTTFPRVNMRSDGYFFIGWNDNGGYDYYGRRFDNIGNPNGNPNNPYLVPISAPPSSTGVDNIRILGDKIYSVWTDDRNGNADIYCNVRGFQNPDTTLISIKPISKIAGEFKFYTAYPNPFNPSTKIKYQIAKVSYVIVKIYDILGREVKVLVDEKQGQGLYEIIWQADRYASGIYFTELKTNTGFREVQKLVLIK